MPKNRCFDILDPLEGVFGANLVPYPLGHVARQLLKKFRNQYFFASCRGDLKKVSKMAILGHFYSCFTNLRPQNTWNYIFGSKMVHWLRDCYRRKTLGAFSLPLYNRFWRYGTFLTLKNTRFWPNWPVLPLLDPFHPEWSYKRHLLIHFLVVLIYGGFWEILGPLT